MAKRRTKAEIEAATDAVLWHALEKVAKGDKERDLLAAGSATPVDVEISGTVGKRQVAKTIKGELTVGEDQPSSSSSGVDQAHLLAVILTVTPRGLRERLLNELPTEFEREGALQEVDEPLLKRCEAMLERLRVRVPTTKRGNVTFKRQRAEVA